MTLVYSRRERHAKTLEIAQEEVLTCLGICMYERLHRIYMRMREEECTCQVFAAVAVDTLSRSFETAVERKRGFSQLELLYAELAREEQQKQIRKEQKKIKRKRKKGKTLEQEGKENCNDCGEDFEDNCSYSHNESCYSCEELLSPLKLKCNEDYEQSDLNELWIGDCKCDEKENKKCNNYMLPVNFKKTASDHSHDYGYSSENNNGCCETASLISSISSSPEGSDLACYDVTCCHEIDTLSRFSNGEHPSLQQMLEVCTLNYLRHPL